MAARSAWPVARAVSAFFLERGEVQALADTMKISIEACAYLVWADRDTDRGDYEPKISSSAIRFHEAGHAVVGAHFKRAVSKIEIRECDGTTWVDTVNETESGTISEATAREELSIIQAGVAAQSRYLGFESSWLPLSTNDRRRANSIAGSRGWDILNFSVTDEIVDRHWNSIVALATALPEIGEISGERLAQILVDAAKN